MRLLTKKIFRAFPELDRYNDEQCERFVRAASGSFIRRAGRGFVCLILCIAPAVLVPLLPLLYEWITERSVAGWTARGPGALTLLTALALLAAPLLFFLARDRLLSRRVRYVLRARGVCAGCRYTLVGVPVPTGNSVICPECGMECEVDPSLGELVLGDHGQRVFEPKIASTLTDRFFTPRRVRFVKRALLYSAIVLFFVVPALIGGYEIFLRRQAALALAEAPSSNALMELGETVQGAPAAPEEPDGWALMLLAHDAKTAIDSRVWRNSPILTSDGQEVMPEPSVIGATLREGRAEKEVIYDAACDALSRRMIEEYRDAGLYTTLAKLNTARRSLPNLSPTAFSTAGFGTIRNLARLNAGRMAVARERNDLPEFAAAFENNLAIGRLLRLQPTILSHLVGIAIEALAISRVRPVVMTHAPDEWLDAIEGALERQRSAVPFEFALEGERTFALSMISNFFGDPSNVRFGQFSRAATSMSGATAPAFNLSDRMGTYEANKNAYNIQINSVLAASRLPRWERPALGAESRYILVRAAFPAFERALMSNDQIALERSALRTMIALERFNRANNRYPDSLTQLVPTYLSQPPIDAWSGKPLGYKLIDPATDPHKRGYILYSFGNDGIDNGGKSGAANYGRDYSALTSPATPNSPKSDFVLNVPD